MICESSSKVRNIYSEIKNRKDSEVLEEVLLLSHCSYKKIKEKQKTRKKIEKRKKTHHIAYKVYENILNFRFYYGAKIVFKRTFHAFP